MKTYNTDQLCRDYHITTAAIRDCTRLIRAERCPEESTAEYDDNGRCTSPGGMSCLTGFYAANDIGEGQSVAFAAVMECDVCRVKHTEVQKRKELRRKLAGIKRRIANAGRRALEGEKEKS